MLWNRIPLPVWKQYCYLYTYTYINRYCTAAEAPNESQLTITLKENYKFCNQAKKDNRLWEYTMTLKQEITTNIFSHLGYFFLQVTRMCECEILICHKSHLHSLSTIQLNRIFWKFHLLAALLYFWVQNLPGSIIKNLPLIICAAVTMLGSFSIFKYCEGYKLVMSICIISLTI